MEQPRSKRGKILSLSLTNNIDVLREKLYMEIARRNRLRNQNQVSQSRIRGAILIKIFPENPLMEEKESLEDRCTFGSVDSILF